MATERFSGPDVLVAGWIPFHTASPQGANFPNTLATPLILQSGNPNPPIAFADYGGFANWIYPLFPVGTKEYRAAFYLEGVVAEFSDDGSAPKADCTGYDVLMGYTPLRFYLGGKNVLASSPQFMQYSRGHGPVHSPTLSVDPAGNWVELCYLTEFKLSWLPNLLSRLTVNAWAPYAWCEIRYRFDKNKQVRIEVHGSAIPNQRLYINWAMPAPAAGIIPEYDMLTAMPNQVSGFLQTTGWGCQPAPARGAQLTWQGQAK